MADGCFTPVANSPAQLSILGWPSHISASLPLHPTKLVRTHSRPENFLYKTSATNRNFGFINSPPLPSPSSCLVRSNANAARGTQPVDCATDTRRPLTDWADSYLLALWLRSSYRSKDARMIHAAALKCLVPVDYSFVLVSNNLVSTYLRLGRWEDARKVFNGLSDRKTIASWTAMLNGYTNLGFYDEAMEILVMLINAGVKPNAKTLVCMLNLCSKRMFYELGKQVHASVIKGCWSNLVVDSAVMYFYAQFGDLVSAFQAFDRMRERDVIAWTTMITTCSRQGCGRMSLSMFSNMLLAGYLPNEHTLCSTVKACGEEKLLKYGKQLHGLVVKRLVKNDVYMGTSLVGMYAKCGETSDSRKVFDRMRKRNMVTWTSIIAGYAANGLGFEALNLFRVMKRRKVMTNNLTVVSILRACGSIRALSSGREVHAQIIKNSTQNNIYIGSTLVWLYCKCGLYALAFRILQAMPIRDVVSWTALISGCALIGREFEALEFLKEMVGEGVEPNPFTYSSVLKACAKLEDIQQGRLIHSSLNKSPAPSNIFVGSALINMYTRCGCLSEAFQVFSNMPERNIVAWRALIVGFARIGHCREALRLMYRMRTEGFEVDDHILSTVLTACGDVEWDMVEPSSSMKCLQPGSLTYMDQMKCLFVI